MKAACQALVLLPRAPLQRLLLAASPHVLCLVQALQMGQAQGVPPLSKSLPLLPACLLQAPWLHWQHCRCCCCCPQPCTHT